MSECDYLVLKINTVISFKRNYLYKHGFTTEEMPPVIIQSLCFDDVLLRPRHSTVKSRSQIDISVDIASHPSRSLVLKRPVIASPMDTVCEARMAIHMALNGGLGIIHRFMPDEEQVQQVATVKRYVKYIITDPYTTALTTSDVINQIEELGVHTFCVVNDNLTLAGLVTRRDMMHSSQDMLVSQFMTPYDRLHCINLTTPELTELMTDGESRHWTLHGLMTQARDMMAREGVEKIPVVSSHSHPLLTGIITLRSVNYYFDNQESATLDAHGQLRVGAAVGIRDGYLEQAGHLVAAGADLLCVDVANGHNEHTLAAVKAIRLAYPQVVIMSGNVCTAAGYRALSAVGSDCVRIGIGNGSICSTRLETGIGYGQFSAVNECMDAMISIPPEEFPAKLVCDGGSLGKTGNKLKALASGASVVMLGRTLAGCEESPGQVIERNNKRVKYFRGMASRMANLSKQERVTGHKRKHQLDTEAATEGVDGITELKGPVSGMLNQICAGIRSGMSYLGVYSMGELHELRRENKIEWAQCTAIGLSETGIRVTTL
jgi:IMP dehydrogenase